jgi:pimeloyl-ACP methyl ester carboxylesterase
MRAVCHLAILLIACHRSHSLSGFLLTGPAVALLLDRYLLRPRPVRSSRVFALAGLSFLVGTAIFYFMRPRVVALSEAAFRGAAASVLVLSFQWAVALWGRWPWTLLLLSPVAVPFVGTLHPLHTVPKRTPAAFGLDFEHVRFTASDGVRLAGWLIPYPNARGNVIFCHGHGRNRGHVAGLLPTLHDLRLNVLAFDFRGHGESEGDTCTFGCKEVRDLTAAVNYLERRYPGKPLFLVGISLGAAVCLQALPDLPSVQGVWSEGAFSRFSDVVEDEFAWLPACLRRPLLALYDWLAWLDCGLWRPSVNPVDSLCGVRVPVCFCHGQQDELVPFSQSQHLFETYTGPKVHYWVADASHYDVRQRHREEYLDHLRGFIEDKLPGGSFPPLESEGTW